MALRSHAMTIPDADLDEFIRRWEHAFGERLMRPEAQRQASRLITLYKLLARPLPSDAKPLSLRNVTAGTLESPLRPSEDRECAEWEPSYDRFPRFLDSNLQ